MLEDLEKELRAWRENRTAKAQRDATPPAVRSTVKVNGHDVVVVRKKLRRVSR